MNIWIFSDPHFGHKNIVRGTTEWMNDPNKGEDSVSQTRDFDTLEEHNEVLIQNINKCIKPNDIAYCLGDFVMGGKENILKFRKALDVKTLHLVLGNHDEQIRRNVVLETDSGYTNAHSLFTSVNEIVDKKIGGVNMVLFHYPIASFHKEHKGGIHCFGHIHKSNFLPNLRSVNVCMDFQPDFRPLHIDEIKNFIDG